MLLGKWSDGHDGDRAHVLRLACRSVPRSHRTAWIAEVYGRTDRLLRVHRRDVERLTAESLRRRPGHRMHGSDAAAVVLGARLRS